MTYQSPTTYNGGAAEYSTYPEVVEAERAWDSPPQVRTSPNFTEDHSLASKLITQQQQNGTYDPNGTYSQQPTPYSAQQTGFPNGAHQAGYPQQYQQQPLTSHSPAQSQHTWGPGAAAGTYASHGPQSPTMTTTTSDPDAVPISKEGMTTEANSTTPTTPTGAGGGGVGGLGAVGSGRESGSPKRYSRKVVWGLIAALILVMALAGILGGVLGTKAVNDAKESCKATSTSSSSSPTKTSSANASTDTFSVPTTGFVELSCPALDGTTTNVDMGPVSWAFDMTCGAAFSRSANSDIMAIISYSFYHCLQACASLNQNSGSNVCLGAEFDSDLATAYSFGGNCYLSNSTNEVTQVNSGESANLKVTGILKT